MGSSMELKTKTNDVIFVQNINFLAHPKSNGVAELVAALRDMTSLVNSTIQ